MAKVVIFRPARGLSSGIFSYSIFFTRGAEWSSQVAESHWGLA